MGKDKLTTYTPHKPKRNRTVSCPPLSSTPNDTTTKNPSHTSLSPTTPHTPRFKRLRDGYEGNKSAALLLPTTNHFLSAHKSNHEKLLSASEQLITEHAARRVDLFFYTLIAYYNSHLTSIERGQTQLQHGIGRKRKGVAPQQLTSLLIF